MQGLTIFSNWKAPYISESTKVSSPEKNVFNPNLALDPFFEGGLILKGKWWPSFSNITIVLIVDGQIQKYGRFFCYEEEIRVRSINL